MKRTICLLFLCFLLLLSCENTPVKNVKFLSQKEISFEEMNIGDRMGRVLSLKTTADYLFVNERNTETQLQLIDKKTKRSYYFGLVGEGPGRVLIKNPPNDPNNNPPKILPAGIKPQGALPKDFYQ